MSQQLSLCDQLEILEVGEDFECLFILDLVGLDQFGDPRQSVRIMDEDLVVDRFHMLRVDHIQGSHASDNGRNGSVDRFGVVMLSRFKGECSDIPRDDLLAEIMHGGSANPVEHPQDDWCMQF